MRGPGTKLACFLIVSTRYARANILIEYIFFQGYKSGSPSTMHRPKSHPGGQHPGRSPKCDKSVIVGDKFRKIGSRKALSDSFSPSHGAGAVGYGQRRSGFTVCRCHLLVLASVTLG